MKPSKKANNEFGLFRKIKSIVLSSKGFPIFFSFTLLAILLVFFRMRNVEMDYKISKINKVIEKIQQDNKELKAKNAKMISNERLRRLASLHKLEQPKQDQIIVIP